MNATLEKLHSIEQRIFRAERLLADLRERYPGPAPDGREIAATERDLNRLRFQKYSLILHPH